MKKQSGKVTQTRLSNEEAIREFGASFTAMPPRKSLRHLCSGAASALTLQIDEEKPDTDRKLKRRKYNG